MKKSLIFGAVLAMLSTQAVARETDDNKLVERVSVEPGDKGYVRVVGG